MQGFTLVELAVVLVIGAVIALAGFKWLDSFIIGGRSVVAKAQANAAQQWLVSFALTNNRLPCPDLTGDGFESDCKNDKAVNLGWLPVVTLGMSDRSSSSELGTRPIYAVYRNANGDLANPDQVAKTGMRQAMVATLRAVVAAAPDETQPRVAQQGSQSSKACAQPSGNFAFVVRVPLEPEVWKPADGSTCFIPITPVSSQSAAGLLSSFLSKS